MHSKKVLSIVVLMFVCNAYSSPFRVHSIEIFTSDCDDCGVGVFGEVSVKLCGSGSLQCCETGSLNHLAENDFKPGESNTFEGDFIGTCDGFDLGESTTINLNNAIEIWHDGMDGGKFDWVKVRTSYVSDLLMCNFYSFLDGNDHEMGSGCTITG